MGTSGPTPSTLPRGGSLMRAFSPAAPPVPADRVKNLPGSGMHSSLNIIFLQHLRHFAVISLHFILKAFQLVLKIRKQMTPMF